MELEVRFFNYPDNSRPVLEDVDLAVRPGECVLVAGGSGSGKTTLGLILAGVLPGQHRGAMHGRISLGGESLQFPQTQAARVDHRHWNGLVGYAGQDAAAQLSTIAATVAEEIAFPLENAGMPRVRMQERVRETAAALGLVPLLDRDPGSLSGGQQKLVGIAAAVARRPSYLVLDEPFAGLDYEARGRVQSALTTLLKQGFGIVLLAQDLDPARTMAGDLLTPDRVVLLHKGRAVYTGSAKAAREKASALQLPVLQGTDGRPAAPSGTAATGALSGKPAAASPVLAAEALRFAYGWRRPRPWRRNLQAAPAVDGVGFALGPGECLAVTGANGSGKSTLLRLLTGLSVPQEGKVSLQNAEPDRREAHSSGGVFSEVPRGASGGVPGALLQHPREQLFERTVRREVGAGLFRRLPEADRTRIVEAALARCGLHDDGGLHPYELPASGQRLAALAALLVQAPDLIALDEPTVSLDLPGRDTLAAAISMEAQRGAAVVMVTHDLDFAYRTCSRLLVLSAGKPVAEGPFEDVLRSHFTSGVAYGVAAPTAWLR